MNPNVIASENPLAVRSSFRIRSRRMAGSDAGWGAVSEGNAAGMRSKPK